MEERFPDEAEVAEEELESERADPGAPEVPEADALEQAADVRPPAEEPDGVGDRPEADALDQARAVDDDEADERR